MGLDKKKIKEINNDIEQEVYEILLKIDRNVEFFDVEVHYHRKKISIGGNIRYTDFEIFFENDGKKYLLVLECKDYADASGSLVKELEHFANIIKKIKTDHPEHIVKSIFLVCLKSKEDIPPSVSNEAAKSGIQCYGKLLIDQFKEAIDSLSPGIAFMEFIKSYFDIEVLFDPDTISLKCMKNNNFGKPTYTFSMSAYNLIRIAYVNRANINKIPLNKAYQRAIKRKRLDEISKFVKEQKSRSNIEIFPNNIVANFRGDIKFIPDNNENEDSGHIEFQNRYGAIEIIDGQHRAYSFCKIEDEIFKKRYNFIVTAYSDINSSQQAEIFYTINDKQEGINADLIMFILAQLQENSKGYAAKIVLDIDKEGLFTKPIKKGFEENEKGAWLKLSTLVHTLTEEGLINYEKSSGGLLQKDKDDDKTPFIILREYINYLQRHFRSDWEQGKNGIVQNNQGLAIMLIVLKNIIETKVKTKEDDLDRITEKMFEYYLGSIDIKRIKKLLEKDLGDIRSRSDRKEAARQIWNEIK